MHLAEYCIRACALFMSTNGVAMRLCEAVTVQSAKIAAAVDKAIHFLELEFLTEYSINANSA